jgi:hypothetical protein
MTRTCKLPFGAAALALLTCCAASFPPPPPPPAPRPLAQPAPSAADIQQAEQHAYWSGYAAGRRYEKEQNAQNTPDAQSAASAAAPELAVATPMPVAAPPASVPVQPVPPPADSYAAKGPARPVATPLN